MALSVMIIFRMTATMTTFGFFVGGGKTIMEDFESGIVSAGAHGGQVEDVTDRQTSAIDAAASFELSAVEVIRCKSDEGGDCLRLICPSSGNKAMRVKA